jgi:uncharacterized protein (TIGR02246 family)
MEKISNNLRKSNIHADETNNNSHENNRLLRNKYEAINQLHQKDMAALQTQNIDMFVTLVTEDCIMLPPAWGPLCGRDAIWNYLKDKYTEWETYKVASYDQQFEEIKIIGDIAYEWGTSKGVYNMKKGGPDIFENSRVFRILRSQPDGSWKIARAIWHDVP